MARQRKSYLQRQSSCLQLSHIESRLEIALITQRQNSKAKVESNWPSSPIAGQLKYLSMKRLVVERIRQRWLWKHMRRKTVVSSNTTLKVILSLYRASIRLKVKHMAPKIVSHTMMEGLWTVSLRHKICTRSKNKKRQWTWVLRQHLSSRRSVL